MKKLMLIAAFLSAALGASAQDTDAILKSIASSKARDAKVESRFKEVRHFPSKPEAQLEGMLKYDPSGKLLMKYDNGEEFSIDGDIMVIDRDGKRTEFNTSKNIMMRGLQHALIYAYQGRLRDIATEQNARLLTSSKDGQYIVTISAQKVAPRGYSNIEIKYNAKTGALEAIRMDEFTGARTFYSYIK